MAAKAVIRCAALLAAAMTIVAAPAFAQTNDPNLSQTEIDCLNGNNAAGADCAKGGGTPGAVFLPELIVDLFPNPADAPAPAPAPPADAPAVPAAPGGPIVAPTDLVATEPPRAVIGEFVPDEVLVTVDGDAGAVQQIATAFGLQVRSQRQSRLLGTTLVRFCLLYTSDAADE